MRGLWRVIRRGLDSEEVLARRLLIATCLNRTLTNPRDCSHQHEEGRPTSSNGFWVYGLSGDQRQNNNSQLRSVQLLAHVVGVSAPKYPI